MKQKEIKSVIADIADVVSFSSLCKNYFLKDKSWFYHKLHEDKVNNVVYEFSDEELQILIDALHDISERIKISCDGLKRIKRKREREKGRYLTTGNPFSHELFHKWFSLVPQGTVILEPFAGCCHIPVMLNNLGVSNAWTCYDVDPLTNNYGYKVMKRNTLKHFPKGYKCIITNPPYLAKNSATKRGINYPDTIYDNVYKLGLSTMLDNAEYVAAILPESFIASKIFQERLFGVISITDNTFANTAYPVCLAMFVPYHCYDFPIYVGAKFVGNYNELTQYALYKYNHSHVKWKFNDKCGSVGVICYDSSKGGSIKFVEGNTIPPQDIKISSRAVTRISGLPLCIPLPIFIARCNVILADYRINTQDVFLAPFKELRKDGRYRRRIDFATIKRIMNKTYAELSQQLKYSN